MEDVSQILSIIKRNIYVARGYLPVEEYYLLTPQSYECGMKEAEMDVDGFSVHEHWLERLHGKPVQGWSTIEKDRAVVDKPL